MHMKGFFQNAYVTRDLNRAVDLVRERYGFDDFIFLEPKMEVTTLLGRGPVELKVALIWAGNLQLELIEPISGFVEVYREFLAADCTPRFHHICVRVDDISQVRAEIEQENAIIAYEGSVEGAEWIYVDTRDALGHYTEYMWASPETWAFIGGR